MIRWRCGWRARKITLAVGSIASLPIRFRLPAVRLPARCVGTYRVPPSKNNIRVPTPIKPTRFERRYCGNQPTICRSRRRSFHTTSTQNGISAYDSVPGTLTHYQPFDIAEPLTDSLTAFSLNVNYKFSGFDLTSSTARWTRNSSQVEEASEAFNNPAEAIAYNYNYGLGNPGYYGAAGTGPEHGIEDDPSHQFSEELRLSSNGDGKASWVGGIYYSNFYSLWGFNGTTPNYSAYMDLGTLAPATTTHWFDAYSPTKLTQYAGFGDVTYELTDALKIDVGGRVNHYDYRFSSCISGWGSGNGAATPSCSGLIALSSTNFNPKANLSYTFSSDLMMYATVSTGFRPGGGNAVYPTTGAAWGGAFQQQGYTTGKWPTTYAPDRVISYEVGEKARMLDRRLTVNASVYHEDWRHPAARGVPERLGAQY